MVDPVDADDDEEDEENFDEEVRFVTTHHPDCYLQSATCMPCCQQHIVANHGRSRSCRLAQSVQ